ncbi:unnamed protein product [Symbiodinium microadriaticum]|nr:unnamed protein product [Symbiodinium microadriaticum]
MARPNASVLESLVAPETVRVLRDFLAGCPTPVAAEGVLTASYWTPLDAPPQNTVDALIADLFCHPSISAVVGPAIGAEWWWQDVDETDPPKVYHKDCNIFLEHDEATKLFPDWSSVLYLTDIGGATAMFENDEVHGRSYLCGPRQEGICSFPAFGCTACSIPKSGCRVIG